MQGNATAKNNKRIGRFDPFLQESWQSDANNPPGEGLPLPGVGCGEHKRIGTSYP